MVSEIFLLYLLDSQNQIASSHIRQNEFQEYGYNDFVSDGQLPALSKQWQDLSASYFFD
ncbi:hypothetical protein D3C81_1191410 [compost metagenome]